jgi:hypothetical protein
MEDEGIPMNTSPSENAVDSSECRYTDVALNSPYTCPRNIEFTDFGGEELTFASSLHVDDYLEAPPIAIAAENVQVVHQEEDHHLFKNIQQVVIT